MATLIYINAVQGVVTKSNKSQWCLPQSAPYDVHVNNNQRTAGKKKSSSPLMAAAAAGPMRYGSGKHCDVVIRGRANRQRWFESWWELSDVINV